VQQHILVRPRCSNTDPLGAFQPGQRPSRRKWQFGHHTCPFSLPSGQAVIAANLSPPSRLTRQLCHAIFHTFSDCRRNRLTYVVAAVGSTPFCLYVRVCPTCCTVIQNHISFFIIRKFASYKVTVVDLLCYCVGFTWCTCVPGWLLSSDTKTTCMLLHRLASLVLMLLIL
jgi:hypothetical protein